MNAQRRRIVMACAHHWTSTFQVAGQQLARALAAEGWDVAFVSNPISPLHLIRARCLQLRQRLDIWRRGGISDLDGHLWAYVPGSLLTPYDAPLLRSRTIHRGWHRLTVPNVVRKLRSRGFGSVDVLYFDSVTQPFWLDAIDHRRSVLRVGDLMTGFAEFTREMLVLQADLAKRVDLLVYSARTLEPHVATLEPRRAVHLPNGVDLAHFTGPAPQPADLAAIPGPRAIYVGAMDVWFDFGLVDRVAEAMPDVSFVLVGPDGLARTKLTPRSNVHLLGPRPYAAVPGYLQHADVGLIPFDVAAHPDLVNSIHPLKLYEYLASGIPVVATRWTELEGLASPARLCRTLDEHVAAIRESLDQSFDAATARAFAGRADWKGRAAQLIATLGV